MNMHVEQWNSAYAQPGTAHKNRYPSELIISWVLSQRFPRGRVLDIGCGWGNNLRFLLDEGYDAYGVDFAESAIEGIRPEFGNRVSCQNMRRTSFEDNTFDFAIDRGSVQHNPVEELPAIYAEIFRVLKPGGRLYSVMRHTGEDGRLHAAPTEAQLREALGAFEIVGIDLLRRTEQNQKTFFECFLIDVRKP